MFTHTRRPRLLTILLFFSAVFASSAVNPALGRDWIHWRGPEQNGVSREKNLPDSFNPKAGAKGNIIWHQPFGGRSAPLVMDGKLYVIQGTGDGIDEGEQVMCFDEATGKPLWKHRVNVFHTTIVSSRLGWTTLTADPATKTVFAHTTAGNLLALAADGKLLWSHNLTEEYGRVSGYGGRIVSPIFDSGLVIIGIANASWGDYAPGRNRFVAFDGKTGEVVWWSDTMNQLKGTYYSSPVIAVINGQRLFITGGADGYLHALKVRTGEQLWSYRFSAGIVNGSPIVDGNLVYCSHGEENPEGGPIGRVICVDGSQIDPKTKTPKLVWERKDLGRRFGLASGAFADGRYYLPDDSGNLFCFDGKSGKMLWEYRYATEVRGAPLIADGKLYIFDVKARFLILDLGQNLDLKPNEDTTFEYKFKDPKGLLIETNGTPIAVNGRIYFHTRNDLYCIGDPKAKPECGAYKPLQDETPFKENAIAGVRLFPADVSAKAGDKVTFKVVWIDANGREVKDNRPSPPATWTLPTPPPPKGKTTSPPPLRGKIEGGVLSLDAAPPTQHGYVEFSDPGHKARARVRVVAQIPYKQDFTNVPVGAVPGGWVNGQGKFLVKQLPSGEKVLEKVNTDPRPPLARADTYITMPSSKNYTIQADVMGVMIANKLPDIGLVNSRYTLILDGKVDPAAGKREVRLVSWEARAGGRVNVAADFNWESGQWYTMKLTVEQKEKTAVARAKVWKKGDKEPEKWTIEFEDPSPNREGAAALYGYISNIGDDTPGSEIYYDNISITPNAKK